MTVDGLPKWCAVFTKIAALTVLAMLPAIANADLPDFTELVEQNHQSVVNISTNSDVSKEPTPGSNENPFEDSPLGELFRRYLEEQGRPQEQKFQPQQFDASSLGSGFIITPDGYVLTNNHVVEGAEEIIVRLHDRRQFVAQLIGRDKQSDVALLKIEADGLPAVRIGQSSMLDVGEWVLAIGSPFGFDFSVTAGIVSAKGRSLPNENYVPFIQTDVAINPGNSGGPLFNLDGEVVGINSQIYSRTGGFMGLSFSIPIEMAMDISDQLKDDGKVSRGWLGVIIQEVTRNLAESFSMDVAHGALVSRILPESPAASSDLEVGDIIVEFNGSYVERSSSLPPLVGRVRAGGEAEKSRDQKIDNPLGIEVEPVSEELSEALDLNGEGVVVSKIGQGPASLAGLRDGDVITMMNKDNIKTIDDFKKALKELKPGTSMA